MLSIKKLKILAGEACFQLGHCSPNSSISRFVKNIHNNFQHHAFLLILPVFAGAIRRICPGTGKKHKNAEWGKGQKLKKFQVSTDINTGVPENRAHRRKTRIFIWLRRRPLPLFLPAASAANPCRRRSARR